MPAALRLEGQKFSRLTVIERSPTKKGPHIAWVCRCDCGNMTVVRGNGLVTKSIQSCGCLNVDVHREMCIKRNTTHGMTKTRVYKIWANLSVRHHHPKYRDVTISPEWAGNFERFFADMGHPPTNRHTLDRIDNAKGYEPGNCRWATMKEQQNNRTNNRRITWRGQTKTLMQWAEHLGIDRKTLSRRFDAGWDIDRAMSTPARPRKGSHREWIAQHGAHL